MMGRLAALRSQIRTTGLVSPAVLKDSFGLPQRGLSHEQGCEEAIAWLCRAQDESRSRDGGVARDYSLVDGWNSSYPETTGYIVPTVLDYSRLTGNQDLRRRARRMLDWLVSIQFPDGGFQGGLVDAEPKVPVTFNTGQILMGLAAGVREFGDTYREPMRRAADWLANTQDPDGCWRKHATPFAAPGEKAYETHVSWGLLEAARLEPDRPWGAAALANVRWALTYQQSNGWFDRCCLTDTERPLTHTIGYVLRGVIEAYRYSSDPTFLAAARTTADALLDMIQPDGFLPGRIDRYWRGQVTWACLTGSVQIAACWMLLHEVSANDRYLAAARAANAYVLRTMTASGPPGSRGGVKGSFPVNGGYGTYQYLNWAAKFLVDSLLLERRLA